MTLDTGTIIADDHGENRWKVIGQVQKRGDFLFHKVEDRAPELKRELFLMTLDYDRLPGKDPVFAVKELRHWFHRMAEILCTNYTFLPEPVDLFRFRNPGENIPERLRDEEPGLVFSQPEGFVLPQQSLSSKNPKKWHKIKTAIRSCAKTLQRLHRNNVVLRALPRETIVLSHTTFKPYFFGFEGLIRMADFKGYNPGKVALNPAPLYSAPECFDPRGYLSPASDVYALGKLVLQIILPLPRFQKMFPDDDPFPADIQNRINDLNLEPFWARFLNLCLHPAPQLRFQNCFELEVFFLEEGKPRATPPGRSRGKQKGGPEKRGGARPSGQEKRTGPWQYRPNPQLPAAALVFWSSQMTQRTEFFDFMGFYHKFIYQYRLEPRLFFPFPSKNPPDFNASFFVRLRDAFGFTVVDLTGKNQGEQTQALFNHLLPESISNLILVGRGDEYAVRELFRHPKAGEWTITWVRGGEGQAPIPIHRLEPASLFIRTKKRKGAK